MTASCEDPALQRSRNFASSLPAPFYSIRVHLRELICTRPCAACLFGAPESQHSDCGSHSDEVQRTTAAQLCPCFCKAASTQHACTQLQRTGESSRTYKPVLLSFLFKQPAGATLSSSCSKQASSVCSQVVKDVAVLQATETISCAAREESAQCHPSVRDKFMSGLMACAAAASVTLAVPASGAFAGEQQPFLSSTGTLPRIMVAACHAGGHCAKCHAQSNDNMFVVYAKHGLRGL